MDINNIILCNTKKAIFYLNKMDLAITPTVVRHNTWEPHLWNKIEPLIKEQEVFIDVGANFGWFVINALSVNPQLQAYAFEANADAFDLLQFNLLANGLYNTAIKRCYVSNFDGKKNITENSMFNTCWDDEQFLNKYEFLSKNVDFIKNLVDFSMAFYKVGQRKSVKISSSRLDSMLAVKNKKVFLKIDCDGSDHLIIEGAQQLLRSNKVTILFEHLGQWGNNEGYSQKRNSFLKGFLEECLKENKKIQYIKNSQSVNELNNNPWLSLNKINSLEKFLKDFEGNILVSNYA